MATFTWAADFGAARKSEPKIRSVKFGDGYEHRLSFGLNTNLKIWTLQFRARSNTEANQIEAFLDAREGVEFFDWTPPSGESGKKWICRSWSRQLDAYNLNTISTEFEQVVV